MFSRPDCLLPDQDHAVVCSGWFRHFNDAACRNTTCPHQGTCQEDQPAPAADTVQQCDTAKQQGHAKAQQAYTLYGEDLKTDQGTVKGKARQEKKKREGAELFGIPEEKKEDRPQQPQEKRTTCNKERFAKPDIMANNFAAGCPAETSPLHGKTGLNRKDEGPDNREELGDFQRNG